ncbi:carbohydrate ABC transporter permease [Robinsoniella peoriensis]|uniref:carbohydrate ABC transporter permease n=1 Tax=Robinsoniella peoriensis TaxID=180332 RepID=UPI003750A3A1
MGRKALTLFTVFTMWFSAGIIPTYMNFSNLGLLDTRAAIIFGFAIETYNLIIMKSFFEQVPEALEEAAFIDGAGHFRVLWNIYLPLSKPALATVGSFYGISRWNGYFWAMQLLKDDGKIPLQVFLKKLIVERVSNPSDAAIVTKASLTSPTTQVYALIILAVVPMIIVFPFIQKYFKSGLTLGGVKG